VQIVTVPTGREDVTSLSSAVHFYTGEVEGKRTLAIAFRSVDEPTPEAAAFEYGFIGSVVGTWPEGTPKAGQPLFGWDVYQVGHAPAVVEALTYAQTHGIEQVLIAGHSLGGILGELTAARLLTQIPFAGLADQTITMTFGQPGSPEDVSGANVFNIFHTDDLVARLSDLSPLFQAGGAAREGVTLPVDRAEWDLPDFKPKDLDTPEELLAALIPPENRLEHSSLLYIDTATLLSQAQRIAPGVNAELADAFRWLQLAADKGTIGTDARDLLVGDAAGDVLFGREGNDRLFGARGDDGIVGGDGNDRAFGGKGCDAFLVGRGRDFVDGGRGTDLAVIEGDRADFQVRVFRGVVTIRSEDAGDEVRTVLTRVEEFSFDDGDYQLQHGHLVPDHQPAAADFIV
jgi:pimeloyl-ACP methyl ester carboxylesterase